MDFPQVGLGTMGIDGPDPIETALEIGYRHLDTAQIYGNQSVVGDGLAAADVAREDVLVATKLWVDALDAADVPDAAADCARKLGVDILDLLYVHRPRGGYDPETTLPAFERLREDGLIGGIGLSNFEPAQLDRAIDVLGGPPVAHQTELHPLYYRPELLDHARNHGYTVVAYSPLAGGRVGDVDAVCDVADKHETTPEAVAIAWALAKEPVVVIPKASSERHLRANLAARNLVLDDDDLAAIDDVEREEQLFPE